MHRFSLIVVVVLIALVPCRFANPSEFLTAIEKQSSWKVSADGVGSATYDSKTLPAVRPQDAAIVLEYGFSKLTRTRLTGPGGKILTLDVYEMLDSAAAYGIFTYLRPPNAEVLQGIGNIGAETSKDVAIQQNRYYIVLSAGGTITAVRQPALQIAGIISKSLPSNFSVPLVSEKLPKENRIPQTEKFVMGPEGLLRLLPLISKDPFGMATGAEAALAKYQDGNETATLLLIYYPTQQLARKFLEAGYKEYSSRYPDQLVFYKRDGPMVVLVVASRSPEFATTLLEKVSYVSTVSWDPKVEPPTVAQVMLRIFTFCGVMLAITFAAGFAFGITRILLKRLFPDKVFDKPKNMEMIRLNLDKK
jgi:hypothetical protein